MIEFENVTKTLASGSLKATVLNDVSLVLPTDRRLAIFGARGSGKTTLIRLLAGVSVPSEGSIRRYARTSFPVGFAGGTTTSHPARHQIRHAAEIYGADPDEVMSFISALPGLGQELDQPMNRLPQQVRLCLGYALGYAIPFDVYLIDNMISVGDAHFRGLCEAMYEERARTSGMIVATRHFRSVQDIVDVGAVLHDGQLTLYEDLRSAIEAFRAVLDTTNQPPSSWNQDGTSS